MRIALVEIVGVLIKEIALEDQASVAGGEGDDERDRDQVQRGEREGVEKREKKIVKLYDLLLERFCDTSSYVRVKVLQTISKLLEYVVQLCLLGL
jgi:condensin complex subunit 1